MQEFIWLIIYIPNQIKTTTTTKFEQTPLRSRIQTDMLFRHISLADLPSIRAYPTKTVTENVTFENAPQDENAHSAFH